MQKYLWVKVTAIILVLAVITGFSIGHLRDGEQSDSILSWKILAEAEVDLVTKGESEILSPRYTDAIREWDGKTVTLKGFMFPLEQTEKHKHFLLSPYPPSCPFCLPAGSSELVEVMMENPIAFSYGEITVSGTFELLEKEEDIQAGMLYRLNKAMMGN